MLLSMDTDPAAKGKPEAKTLVGISFPDIFRAQEFLTAATGLAAKGAIALEDAVVVVKDEDGGTTVTETKDLQAGRSAVSGAVWASLFGLLLGGPVGWIAGAAIGAGAGAVTAKVVDIGIPDEWVGWFRQAVHPGTATIVILADDVHTDALVTEVGRFSGAELVYANLDADTVARLETALDDHDAPGPAPAQPAPPDQTAPSPAES
jgi:uncharacterized membrane protein